MRVGVIGAGVSGLTFAAAMGRLAPEVEVSIFEADASPAARPQGYAIGLKAGGGVDVLRELGLLDSVLAGDTVRVGGFTFTDQRGSVLMTLPAREDGEHATYRVQRSHLKSVLAAGAGGASVTYGRRLTALRPEDDAVTLTFDDGTTERFDAVIAADGVDSAVRRQLVGDGRHELGLAAIYGDARIATSDPLLAGGYVMSLGRNGASFFAYPQPGGTVHFSYTAHVADATALAAQPGEALLAQVAGATAGWLPLVGELIEATIPDSVGVRRYDDRQPLTAVHQGRVWLIGDAAHPMTPFQGQGANMAMVDALRVAEWMALLASDPATAALAGPAVEREIADRGRKAVMESRRAAEQFHVRSGFRQAMRNVGMRVANVFIAFGSRGSKTGEAPQGG